MLRHFVGASPRASRSSATDRLTYSRAKDDSSIIQWLHSQGEDSHRVGFGLFSLGPPISATEWVLNMT
jgi:hypothetical protein